MVDADCRYRRFNSTDDGTLVLWTTAYKGTTKIPTALPGYGQRETQLSASVYGRCLEGFQFHLDYSLTVTLKKPAVVRLEPSSKYRFKCFVFGLNISLGRHPVPAGY